MKLHRPRIIRQEDGAWIVFAPNEQAIFVGRKYSVGFDLDGTLAHSRITVGPPFPIGEPVSEMVEIAKSFLAAGVQVKIFTARACDAENIPLVQDWVERHGLGRLPVTNQKDYDMIRYYDDRAIQIRTNITKLINPKT
jgi:hypothetical protein